MKRIFKRWPAFLLVGLTALFCLGEIRLASDRNNQGYLNEYHSTVDAGLEVATWTANNSTLSVHDPYLVAYWKLENTSDSVGTHTLTTYNSPSFVAGKHNNCIQLNGSSKYADTPDSDDWTPSTSMTISFWIYPNSLGKAAFAHETDSSNTQECYISVGGILYWGLLTGGSYDFEVTSDSSIGTGAWVHVVLVDTGSNQYMYINGSQQTDTGSFSGSWTNFTGTFKIGYWPRNSWYADSNIDEFVIWKGAALSASDVTDLYNGGTGAFYIPN